MSRLRWYIMGAGLLALPFIFGSGVEQMREPKCLFLVTVAGILMSAELGYRVSWPFGIGVAICYISAFLRPLFPYETVLALSAALGSCFFLVDFKKKDVSILLNIFEACGLATAAYAMLLQYPGWDPIIKMIPGNDYHRVSVFFGQHTLYGPFAVMCAAPALFRGRYWRAAAILSPLPAIDSSFTYLSAGVLLSMFAVYKFGKTAILGLFLVATIGSGFLAYAYYSRDFVKYESLNDNGRFQLWKLVWRVSKPRPILGHGLSSFREQFPIFQIPELRRANGIDESGLSPLAKKTLEEGEELKRRSGTFLHPHNEPLLVFYEFGLLGIFVLICCIFTFFFLWVDCQDTPENWALGAIFFVAMADAQGNFIFHLIPQALLPLYAFVLVTTSRDRGILDV